MQHWKVAINNVISLTLLALIIVLSTGCSGSNAKIDDSFDNTIEKEIHGLKYEIPSSWEDNDYSAIPSDMYKEFQGYAKWSEDKNDCLATLFVYYLGDDTIPLNLSGDGFTHNEDNQLSVQIGSEEVTIESYSIQDDVRSSLYSASFVKDYSTFLVVIDSPVKGSSPLDFFKEFVNHIDIDDYCNPRTATKLTAKYTGSPLPDTTVYSDDTTNIEVTVAYDNGDQDQAKVWEMSNDIKIVSGETNTATITCHGLTCELAVTGKKVSEIKAKYKGSTDEGTAITRSNIDVTAIYEDGEKDAVSSWQMDGDDTLKAGKTSKVTITYAGLKYELEIKCTSATVGEANALKMAEAYLSSSAFSRQGLIEQLKFEGFTEDEAEYAVEFVDVSWKEQAIKCAKSYLNSSAFSKSGLYDQLIYEGFTPEQAQYGVDEVYQ